MKVLKSEYLQDSFGSVRLYKLTEAEDKELSRLWKGRDKGRFALAWSEGAFDRVEDFVESSNTVEFYETLSEALDAFWANFPNLERED